MTLLLAIMCAILIGVVGNTIYQTLFMIGLQRTTVGNTAMISSLVISFCAIFITPS